MTGLFEVVRVCCNGFWRHYFFLLQHQNCLAISHGATLQFYFPLAVSDSIGDKFGFTNLRSYGL